MSSKFTQTRRTRARPPVCRAPLRGGVTVKPPAHPAVVIALAEWINTTGIPIGSIAGSIDLFETLPDEHWSGYIAQGSQRLTVEIDKAAQDTHCDISVTMTAPGITDSETFENVPCPQNLCNWMSPFLKEVHLPGVQWHSVQVWA